MAKSKQEPTVPPKHVRRKEFYKRLRESCNDFQKNEISEKAIIIESPNNQDYEKLTMKREIETKRHLLIIDNDKIYGR